MGAVLFWGPVSLWPFGLIPVGMFYISEVGYRCSFSCQAPRALLRTLFVAQQNKQVPAKDIQHDSL